MSNPILIPQPFANNGSKNTIQNTRQSGQDPEDATWSEGFPPVTMQPMESGGLPPKGLDFNGLLNAISAGVVYSQKGGRYLFDASYAAEIGGYAKGAILQDDAGVNEYISLVDNNTTNFNADPEDKWAKYADVAGLIALLGNAAYRTVGEGTDQIPDMSSFASQQADRGYMKLPGGLIIQWGTNYSTSSPSSTLTFPIAFPNSCVHISASGMNASGNTQAYVTFNGRNTTSANYSCFMANGGVAPALNTTPNAVQVWWIAIGY